MAFIARLCDAHSMLDALGLRSISAYLTAISTEGSAEYERVLQCEGEQKVQLDSGSFAIEQSYRLKPKKEAFYEAHRFYVDFQLAVAGEELFSIAPASSCTTQSPYDHKRDLAIYHPPQHSSTLHLRPGMLAIFFPYDVHAGGLGAENLGPLTIHKSVVKVPLTLLRF